MSIQEYSELRQRAQGDCVMRIRVWNDNLAAFCVTAPLVAPKPTAVRVVASDREADGNG